MTKKLNRFLLFSLAISCLCLYGCKKAHQVEKMAFNPKVVFDKACLPGHVFMKPMREVNKPNHQLLIHTEDKDSLYLKFSGKEKGDLLIYGSSINPTDRQEAYFFHFNLVDYIQYSFIKDYVLSHNTHKKDATTQRAYNSIRIVLDDKFDFISYVVEKDDTGYFSHLIDTLRPFENKDLLEKLDYYKNIQERSRRKIS